MTNRPKTPRRIAMKTSFHAIIGLSVVAASMLAVDRVGYGQERTPQRSEVRGVIKSVDFAAPTITLAGSEGRGAPMPEKTYVLSKTLELAVGSAADRSGVFREGQLADLATGTSVILTLSADQSTVESVVAEGP